MAKSTHLNKGIPLPTKPPPAPHTYEERLALCQVPVTLDGKPARVCGARLDYPRVAQIPSGLSVEYCWATVKHVIEKHGGKFESAA